MKVMFGAIRDLPVKAYFAGQDGKLTAGDNWGEERLPLAVRREGFTGALGEVSCVWSGTEDTAAVFVGLGAERGAEPARRAAAKLVEWADGRGLKELGLWVHGLSREEAGGAAEGAVMAHYQYTQYLTRPAEKSLERLVLDGTEELAGPVEEGVVLGECVNIARDLVNEPANVQSPLRLAQEVEELGRRFGFETQVLGEEEIRELGMEALLQVSKGSPNSPAVIVTRYLGDPERPGGRMGLIGKGVTYDSGGLNLKSGQRFITMKHDMAGGATVIGAMCAAAARKLKVNAVAVVAACENLISGQAYRPGDIIGSMGGKTIQVNSTDAEGRLTLIDAMTYAIRHEKVDRLVDIATLTGAARRILGEYGAPVLGNDSGLWDQLSAAGERAGELVCRVPLVEDARAKIRGDVSDLVNTTLEQTGGMVTAALFLEEFTEGRPWAHIDAAGPLWLDHQMPYTPKGGSGWGVRTLYYLLKNLK